MKSSRILLLVCCVIAFLGKLQAQLIEVPLEKRIANSAVIIEGEVVHSHCFWGDNRRIYSSHTVRIDKVMKGMPSADTLEIILEGGVVDGHYWEVTHCLALSPKMQGVFFLNPLGAMHPAKKGRERVAYDVYSSMQGFIEYSFFRGSKDAADPFHVYHDVEADLYPLLGFAGTASPYRRHHVQTVLAGGPVVDSIRPLELTAGTRTILRIYGHGFQNSKGTVRFPDADKGGALYMTGDSTDIKEWNDTIIRLWVPSYGPFPTGGGIAGTGPIIVHTSSGDSAQSLDSLLVRFSIKNSRTEDTLTPPLGISRFLGLFDHDTYVGNDTVGGYTFHCTNGFSASDSAEAVFRQALRQWRCATGANFKMGADTILNRVEADFICVVRWDDQPDTLPTGVLASTRTLVASCSDGVEQAFVIYDIDFTFRRNSPWGFDTTAIMPNKLDFYSVGLHEIGHAHGLGHVIENGEVMDFDIAIGQRNAILTPAALEAGSWVMDSSTVQRGACPPPMTRVEPTDCNMLPITQQTVLASELYLFPNPTGGVLHIQSTKVGGDHQVRLTLHDAKGNYVSTDKYDLERLADNSWIASLVGLPSGLYFLMIQMGSEFSNYKIVLLR